MTRKLLLLAMAIAALAVPIAFAACGDDDDDDGETTAAEETAAGPTEVTLTADDAGGNYTFELSETPTLDTESVTFDNQGEESHALVFARINEGYTVDEAFELEGSKGSAVLMTQTGAPPGKSKTVELQRPMEPGNYAMLCPIGSPEGPHYKLGQLEEFTIE